jgi:predicted ATPase
LHFERGGDLSRAIEFLVQAGENAARRFACREAIAQYRHAIALLRQLPEGNQRCARELPIQIALGQALTAVEGNAAPVVGDAYRTARDLCAQLGDPIPALFACLAGLFLFHLSRADIQSARQVAEQLMQIARASGDPYLLLNGHTVLLVAEFYGGEVVSANVHAETLFIRYDRQDYLRFATDVGYDARAIARAISACTLHALGLTEQAQQRAVEAVATARASNHPLSLAQTLTYTARYYLWCRDVEAARREAEALIAVCEEQGFALLLTGGTFIRGWARIQEDELMVGIAAMQKSFEEAIRLHSEIGLVDYSVWLAQAYGRAGWCDRALELITAAQQRMERGGERMVEAELYRTQGELLLQSVAHVSPSVDADAEQCFQDALSCARARSMKAWELRAAVSLARLRQRQGRRREAIELLAPVYGSFREGLTTPDLAEAHALLSTE